jgi:hypothetical protein
MSLAVVRLLPDADLAQYKQREAAEHHKCLRPFFIPHLPQG